MHRQTDFAGLEGSSSGITIDRKIPLWGILTLVAAMISQAALVWSGQREQAIEMRHLSEQTRLLAIEVKALTTQSATKDGKDIEQDLRINELSRRVLSIETREVRR